MRVVRVVLTLVVALLIACPLMAQEKKKGRRGGGSMLDRILAPLNLTDDQKAKVEGVKKEFASKQADIAKKRGDILTADQKKARADAEKAAKDAGKSRREVMEAARAAVTLTDAQKKEMGDVAKAERELFTQQLDKVKAILTPEQKEKLEKQMEEMKSKMGKKKKG